jgi:hypothetical protein
MGYVRGPWALAAAALLVARAAEAQPPERAPAQPTNGELARELVNPVSQLTSIPVQYDSEFGIGPAELVRGTVSLRPTLAFPLTPHINLVSRTILPLESRPDVAQGGGTAFGPGDASESLFIVPPPAGGIIWGLGPTFSLPTASPGALGTGQLGLGPTAAVLVQPGPWTLGVLAVQVWSLTRPPTLPVVDRVAVTYLGSLRFPGGWYVRTSPLITVDWNAPSVRNALTIPLGGGAGKVFHVGRVPFSVSVEAYWNAVRPDTPSAASGSAEMQVALLFPK